jgi:hypothetical protein
MNKQSENKTNDAFDHYQLSKNWKAGHDVPNGIRDGTKNLIFFTLKKKNI